MLKWERRYKLTFEIGERKDLTAYIPRETITVEYPFTLKLNIQNSINMMSVSSASLQILNLSKSVQAKLWKDNFDATKYVRIWLWAGYAQSQMPLIFVGDVLECYSYREEGGVDWITDIKSSDGSFLIQYGVANLTMQKGSKVSTLIEALLENTPHYKTGYISSNLPELKRNRTYIGHTMSLLGKEYGGYEIFIDKGELNILDENDVIPSDIQVITAESGLLGSPRRSGDFLECTTIFEPGIKAGQAIELKSDTLPFVNNIYKVQGISHNGIISPVESGKLTTTLQLWLGAEPFNTLKKATNTYEGTPAAGQWVKPVNGSITSRFGYRKNPVTGEYGGHEGIDIGANYNTPIKAAADGRVRYAAWNDGYGYYVSVDNGTINGKKITSGYGHMIKSPSVVANQQVYKGQTILGYIGSTGRSTGPHLHFEIKENGNAVNPLNYYGGVW